MLSFLRSAKPLAKPFDFSKNRFPARHVWPPQFDDLSSKEKFKLERKFRRRAKLKWARPGWNKGLILVQWATIGLVVGYATLYMDWSGSQTQKDNDMPEFLKSIRRWYFGIADGIWSQSSSIYTRAHVEMMQEKLAQEERIQSQSSRST